MKTETITVIEYEPGDIIDISKNQFPTCKQTRELREANEVMILGSRGKTYRVLTDNMKFSNMNSNYCKNIRYIRHVNLFTKGAADGEEETDGGQQIFKTET